MTDLTATIREHLYHPVKDAGHLVVCTCGEVFYATPAQSTAAQAWAGHLAEMLGAVTR